MHHELQQLQQLHTHVGCAPTSPPLCRPSSNSSKARSSRDGRRQSGTTDPTSIGTLRESVQWAQDEEQEDLPKARGLVRGRGGGRGGGAMAARGWGPRLGSADRWIRVGKRVGGRAHKECECLVWILDVSGNGYGCLEWILGVLEARGGIQIAVGWGVSARGADAFG